MKARLLLAGFYRRPIGTSDRNIRLAAIDPAQSACVQALLFSWRFVNGVGIGTMISRMMGIVALVAAALALPQTAHAASGQVLNDLNLRTCASVRCARIAVMPQGSHVWIQGSRRGWYQLNYRGIVGFASARYIAVGGPFYRRPPPPPFGYYRAPWWDGRYGAWYDGRRWYFDGRWYDRPGGFYFGFRFGR